MIKKYRKKPVEIEAVQLKDFNQATIKSCLEFMVQSVNTECMMASDRFDEYCSMLKHQGGLFIETLEGRMLASEGDFIIKGINGEFYPCKPDIFKKTYDEVDEDLKKKGEYIVHDNEDGLSIYTDNYSKALEEYEKCKKYCHDYVVDNAEFSGDERIILAKVEKVYFSTPIGEFNEDEEELWDFKEE